MTRDSSLREDLRAYRDARGSEDEHALAARRRRMLPALRRDADSLVGASDLRTAIAILTAAEQAAFGPLPPGDGVLKSRLTERLAAIPADSYRVPVLLLDIVPPFLSEEDKKIPAKRNMFAAGAMKKAKSERPPRSCHQKLTLPSRPGPPSTDLSGAWLDALAVQEVLWGTRLLQGRLAAPRSV